MTVQMDTQQWIAVHDFCVNLNIEVSLINSLESTGLIEITTIEEVQYIHANQLPQLEKMVRMYEELDINVEGIETIHHLLQRISDLQIEITTLKNRLRLYEASDS